MHVAASSRFVLLGLEAVKELGIVKCVTEVGSSEVYEVCYPQMFQGFGTFAVEYTIRLEPNSVPHAVHVRHCVPILNMERQGVVQNVEGLIECCAYLVLVLKPSGDARICVGFCHLNPSVLRERYVLPNFSNLNGNSGFYQVD